MRNVERLINNRLPEFEEHLQRHQQQQSQQQLRTETTDMKEYDEVGRLLQGLNRLKTLAPGMDACLSLVVVVLSGWPFCLYSLPLPVLPFLLSLLFLPPCRFTSSLPIFIYWRHTRFGDWQRSRAAPHQHPEPHVSYLPLFAIDSDGKIM